MDLLNASIAELKAGLTSGAFSSIQLTKAYLDRIEEVNRNGPELHAVIEANAAALELATISDARRQSGSNNLGLLEGIPILLKDNIGTISPENVIENLNTTAGSLALYGCFPSEEATVVTKLRNAGAIILGKLNLSEWANWRGNFPDGWSARGGQTTNPYARGHSVSGSSSGSAVAAAVGLAAGTLGTETDGSIISPSNHCNIVGLKPTVGLTSRFGVIPISKTQDTVGPMCRTVEDVTILLQVIAGPDPRDPYTLEQPTVPDYRSSLSADYLKGKRVGVLRGLFTQSDAWKNFRSVDIKHIQASFEAAVRKIETLGAILVDPVEIPSASDIFKAKRLYSLRVLRAEFKEGLNQYLSTLSDHPTGVATLEDLIAFNLAHEEEKPGDDGNQEQFVKSNESSMNEEYYEAIQFGHRMGRVKGIDAALTDNQLDVLIMPCSDRTCHISAMAGYPLITVPLGFLPGPTGNNESPFYPAPDMPFGLAFAGTKWSEKTLLGCAYSFEQHSRVRWSRLPYEAAIPKTQLKL